MKHLHIKLSDKEASALNSAVARGEFASEAAVIHEALSLLFEGADWPDEAQLRADIADWQSGQQITWTPEQVMTDLAKTARE